MLALERISFARIAAIAIVGVGVFSTMSANAADDLMAQFEMSQSQVSKALRSDLKASLESAVMIPEIPAELREKVGTMMAAMEDGGRRENS